MSKKVWARAMAAAMIVVACVFAWLCFTVLDRPASAVILLAVASFAAGYVNGGGRMRSYVFGRRKRDG